MQDDNFISFIKGAIKIRQCYQTYNYCRKLLEKMEWRGNEHLQHFAGGVLMGCGTFNVVSIKNREGNLLHSHYLGTGFSVGFWFLAPVQILQFKDP